MLIQQIEAYLSLRRSGGFDLRHDGLLLHNFARQACQRGETHVCAHSVVEWAGQAPSVAQRDRRLKTVIRFARYARLEDSRHELPPGGVFGHQRHRPVPFVFTRSQVQALIQAAAGLVSSDPSRAHTCSVLFALLAVTGLRISEALALRLDDLTADGLVIRKTKFRKSRLLPLHRTTEAALEHYRLHHRPLVSDNHLFVTGRGRALSYFIARQTLLSLVQQLGLPRQAARLHNFRHTFVVRALESCPDGRDRIAQHMVAVSTYLGHSQVSHTYWYLQATPQLLLDIADATENFLQGESQ